MVSRNQKNHSYSNENSIIQNIKLKLEYENKR